MTDTAIKDVNMDIVSANFPSVNREGSHRRCRASRGISFCSYRLVLIACGLVQTCARTAQALTTLPALVLERF
jgi:hypothetical protein